MRDAHFFQYGAAGNNFSDFLKLKVPYNTKKLYVFFLTNIFMILSTLFINNMINFWILFVVLSWQSSVFCDCMNYQVVRWRRLGEGWAVPVPVVAAAAPPPPPPTGTKLNCEFAYIDGGGGGGCGCGHVGIHCGCRYVGISYTICNLLKFMRNTLDNTIPESSSINHGCRVVLIEISPSVYRRRYLGVVEYENGGDCYYDEFKMYLIVVRRLIFKFKVIAYVPGTYRYPGTVMRYFTSY